MRRYHYARKPIYRRRTRRTRDSEKYNYSVTALVDPDTYAKLEEEDYKERPDDFAGTDIENYEEGSDKYNKYFYDLGDMDFSDNLYTLYMNINRNPAKITGKIGRWDGSHEIEDDYRDDIKETIDTLIYSKYDKHFKLMATPDFKHFKYTESNHDSSGTALYIDEISEKEYDKAMGYDYVYPSDPDYPYK